MPTADHSRPLLARAADGTRYRARLRAVHGEDLHLRQEPGRDDRGRPLKVPKGTPDRPVIPIADVATARVEVEFDPPADLAQLLADAETTAADRSAAQKES
ncbi:MAG: hypothetical protein L0J57_11165 [Brachybacterium sp.]|nr:hypothetical protein [Brachybacterium sp.]